jgi:catechol 2,3-dioxygenase-like lactoylglutathione lyase family enzyme
MGRPQEAFRILRLGHCVLRVRDLSAAHSFSIDVLGFVPALEERDALSVRGIADFDLWTLGLVRLDEPGLDHFALRWSTPTISMHSRSCTAHSASQSLGSRQGESQAKGSAAGSHAGRASGGVLSPHGASASLRRPRPRAAPDAVDSSVPGYSTDVHRP